MYFKSVSIDHAGIVYSYGPHLFVVLSESNIKVPHVSILCRARVAHSWDSPASADPVVHAWFVLKSIQHEVCVVVLVFSTQSP